MGFHILLLAAERLEIEGRQIFSSSKIAANEIYASNDVCQPGVETDRIVPFSYLFSYFQIEYGYY
jgi:hypothetical protein